MYQKHQPMKKERIQGHMKKRETGNLAGILAGAGIMIILAGGLIAFSGPLYKSIAGRNLPVSDVPIYNAGTYEGSARGYGGPITVKAKFSEYGIEDVKVEAPDETPEIGKSAAVRLSKDIWANQSHSVDSISGATMTSNAVKTAMGACVREAVKEGTE
ncbi:FMN-binding protein, partial [Enterococcus avium]